LPAQVTKIVLQHYLPTADSLGYGQIDHGCASKLS
jgi:hypothetical protein